MFVVANCGQVDARIPAKKYIDVYRYILQLRRRERARYKGLEQLGDKG